MKKLLFVALVLGQMAHAQIAYYDAIRLSSLLDNTRHFPATKKDEVLSILNKYVGADITSPSSFSESKKNIFISQYFNSGNAYDDNFNPVSRSLLPSFLGGLDVTNIANGVADFMIERAKQELTVTFFDRFQNFSSKHEEFRVLFPKTSSYLANLLTYQYPQMMPVLRNGFVEDLSGLTYRLDDVLELPKYHELLNKFPEIRIAIRSLRLVQELENKEKNIADILDEFSAFEEWKDNSATNTVKNMGGSLKLASVFSGSLRSTADRIWITSQQANDLVKDKDAFMIYAGLIHQLCRINNICFYEKNKIIRFDSVLAAQKDNLILVQNKVQEFIALASRVDKQLATLKTVKPTDEDYYNYIGTSIDVLEYSFGLFNIFNDEVKVDEYMALMKNANEVYKNVYSKEYPSAVINSVNVLCQVINMVKANPAYSSVSAATLKNVKDMNDFLSAITKYALFMANVAVAKSADEVTSAIENAALPVGSSSLKKNSSFNISIQSYLGAYGALARTGKVNNSWSDPFGVIAPIGVAFSFGFSKYGSASFFPTLFDLGAIVDYKLTSDSTINSNGKKTMEIHKDYKVQLGQLFSPGAYLVYGFPCNIPLSIGVGAQYGPGLSKIDISGTASVSNPYWRYNLFLAVDIPFFNLFTVRKK